MQLRSNIIVALCAALAIAQPIAAHDTDEREQRSIEAQRIEEPPTIDAYLREEAWQVEPMAYDFIDIRDASLAEEQTDVWIYYDDEFIYVAAQMFQDQQTVNATERTYDRLQLRFEDYLQVNLDTFHDHKRTYVFLVSPLGIRWDSRDGVFDRNAAWDADWEAAARIEDDRWIVEMKIPIGVMHHNSDENEQWGLNFRRRRSLENYASHWNYNEDAGVPGSARGPKFVADFGHWDNLDLSNIVIDRTPDIEQYGSLTLRRNPGSDDVHTLFSTGFDLNMRLNSNWITTLSANPDFAEVAADDGDIENRDTQRFLEERRNFFKEGNELFQTPINIYDSRAIVDFDTAAKVTGTGDNWTIATLTLRGEGTDSGKNSNISVARATYNPSDDVQLGSMLVGVDRQKGYNVVAGVDARVEFGLTNTWTTQYLYMIDEDRDDFVNAVGEETRQSEHGFETVWEGGSRPWFYRFEFTDISEDFDPDLSFIPRRDIVGPTFLVEYFDDYDHPVIESMRTLFEYEYYQNHAGRTILRDYFFQTGIDFQNDFDVELSYRDDFHDPFFNTRAGIELRYKRQDRFRSWEGDVAWGEFEQTKFWQVSGEKPFRIKTDRWTHSLRGTFRQEDPQFGSDEDVWLARYETEYRFLWDGRIKLTWEEGSDESHLRTLLFAYEDVRDWDFYIVVNDFRFAGEGVEPDEETLEFITKFVYRWRPPGKKSKG